MQPITISITIGDNTITRNYAVEDITQLDGGEIINSMVNSIYETD